MRYFFFVSGAHASLSYLYTNLESWRNAGKKGEFHHPAHPLTFPPHFELYAQFASFPELAPLAMQPELATLIKQTSISVNMNMKASQNEQKTWRNSIR